MVTFPPSEVKQMKNDFETNAERLKLFFKKIGQLFDEDIISYHDMMVFPDMLRVKMAEGVGVKKIPLPPAFGLLFKMDIHPNQELGTHKNKDCFQYTTVERGAIINLNTGEIYDEGDELTIKPGKTYRIKSLDNYTELYILYSQYAAY